MKKREREEPCHICQHYHDYENGEPCSICGHTLTVADPSKKASAYPSVILPQLLYLGSYDNAARSELLKTLGITHILNTLYRNSFTYHTVSTSPPEFQECFDFLDSVSMEKDARVLVHCMTGISRSPSVVIGYLMKLRRWRLSEAYKWVKEHRPATVLAPGEADRLQSLEVDLLGASSTGYDPRAAAAAAAAARAQDGESSSCAASSAPFALPHHADFQWAWRGAPSPPEPNFFTAPIQNITFGQVRQGAKFVFGSRGHDPPPEAGAGGVAMES